MHDGKDVPNVWALWEPQYYACRAQREPTWNPSPPLALFSHMARFNENMAMHTCAAGSIARVAAATASFHLVRNINIICETCVIVNIICKHRPPASA